LSKLGQVQPSPQYSKLILIVESPLLRVGFIKQGRSQPQLKFSQSNRAGVKNAGHPWQLLVKDPVFLATPTQNGVCVMLDWLGKRAVYGLIVAGSNCSCHQDLLGFPVSQYLQTKWLRVLFCFNCYQFWLFWRPGPWISHCHSRSSFDL
jgi:hypothetical protein